VIILVSYLHFSDSEWNRYDFSKFWTLSGISIYWTRLFVPRHNLATATDWWGCSQVRCHTGIDQVKPWLGWSSPPVITGVGDSEASRLICLYCSNEDNKGNPVVVVLWPNGRRISSGDELLRRSMTATYRNYSTDHQMVHWGSLEMIKLTVMLLGWSAR
jgi:hypothetical protein